MSRTLYRISHCSWRLRHRVPIKTHSRQTIFTQATHIQYLKIGDIQYTRYSVIYACKVAFDIIKTLKVENDANI